MKNESPLLAELTFEGAIHGCLSMALQFAVMPQTSLDGDLRD